MLSPSRISLKDGFDEFKDFILEVVKIFNETKPGSNENSKETLDLNGLFYFESLDEIEKELKRVVPQLNSTYYKSMQKYLNSAAERLKDTEKIYTDLINLRGLPVSAAKSVLDNPTEYLEDLTPETRMKVVDTFKRLKSEFNKQKPNPSQNAKSPIPIDYVFNNTPDAIYRIRNFVSKINPIYYRVIQKYLENAAKRIDMVKK